MEAIPKTINVEEPCLRALFHPLMLKSSYKLKPCAILPPPNGAKVSLYRLEYTTMESCVALARNICMRKQTFKGMASLTQDDVNGINKLHIGVSSLIEYAPMNGNEYVDREIDVYVDDPNVDKPMHADLAYSMTRPHKLQPNAPMLKYACLLLDKMKIVYKEEELEEEISV